LKNILDIILIVKVFPAPFRLKEVTVEDETLEDVQRLLGVGEFASVVSLAVRGVVLSFEDLFTQEDERS
jgi:hypothetical protein